MRIHSFWVYLSERVKLKLLQGLGNILHYVAIESEYM